MVTFGEFYKMINKDEYTNHTGGAYGVDTYGCLAGLHLGFKNHNHYRPYDNVKLSKKLKDKGLKAFILPEFAMEQNRLRVNKLLGTNHKDVISGNLQCRNYFQVICSDAIFCFAKIIGDSKISGGTNTALQLAIELEVEAYVFSLEDFCWHHYDRESKVLDDCAPPILTKDYAIIGTRDVEDYYVKNKVTGGWASRKQYLGKEAELLVKDEIMQLFTRTINQYSGEVENEKPEY